MSRIKAKDYQYNKLSLLLLVVLLGACSGEQDTQTLVSDNGQLKLPERTSDTYITSQLGIAGKTLYLWKEKDRCSLEIVIKGKAQGTKQRLAPKAPCHFIFSPGTEQVQIFQRDKTTRVIAFVGSPDIGTPVEPFCGKMVQALIVKASGQVRLSNNVLSGQSYCVGQGLDNDQYTLFSG